MLLARLENRILIFDFCSLSLSLYLFRSPLPHTTVFSLRNENIYRCVWITSADILLQYRILLLAIKRINSVITLKQWTLLPRFVWKIVLTHTETVCEREKVLSTTKNVLYFDLTWHIAQLIAGRCCRRCTKPRMRVLQEFGLKEEIRERLVISYQTS